jgi:hypothetical protein
MEDVAAGMIKPCIADIKIGRQTWDPYSSPEKQLAENVKCLYQSFCANFFLINYFHLMLLDEIQGH